MSRVTVNTFAEMKRKGEKLALLTAYDYITASLLDQVGVDAILVGDSANMVFYGEETTLSIGMDQMIYHTKAVSAAAHRAMVIGDLPFMSYQVSQEEAVRNAGRFLKEGGAQAVKLEGGREMAETIRRLVEIGIPVMGHLGMTPQSIHRLGGYGLRGRRKEEAERLVEDAAILEEMGCFSMVLEKIPASLAREITEAVAIPTIGIGAGPSCDGQVLVVQDMLGIFEEFKPKFARRYAELAAEMRRAFKAYIDDVKKGGFPSEEESY